MASAVDFQGVVKHIVNGSFSDSLCRICLEPLGEFFEDVFTKVCKEDQEYCIADVLDKLCNVKVTTSDRYKVCPDCFFKASSAYKFYLLAQRTEEILEYYVDGLQEHIGSLCIPDEYTNDSICIKLPILVPRTNLFDYNLKGVCLESKDESNSIELSNELQEISMFKKDIIQFEDSKRCNTVKTPAQIKNEKIDINEDIVIVMADDGEPSFYRTNNKGVLERLSQEETKSYCDGLTEPSTSGISKSTTNDVKRRRKRNRMDYKSCSQCPIKYRFVAKLKEHMKFDHNIDIFVCQECKAIIENEQDFTNHLKTHTNSHRCSICNAVFKKRETIIAHLKAHEAEKELSKSNRAHVCEICGCIVKDEASLLDHHEEKHTKKYTCYYCGRMYKGEISFELHIKKHEAQLSLKQKRNQTPGKKEVTKEKPAKKRNFLCAQCSRGFVDERSLMWHQRLHTDEKPYVCEVCGRGFVSVNRRNQHALCAHTAPARRCPLCPALFHLRSMVNSHIKKVHLRSHKRRNRTSKHRNVFWRTEPVPFQELSVAVQADILDLKTSQRDARRAADAARFGFGVDSTLNDQQEQFLDTYCTVNASNAGIGSPSSICLT